MSGNSLLYDACLYDNKSKVQALLVDGYDVNTTNSSHQTALFAACITGSQDMVALLLHAGAIVNKQDLRGQTPLHTALEYEHVYLAKVLHEKYRADLMIRDENGQTPMHIALKKGLFQFAKEILTCYTSDIGTANSWIQLHAACYVGNEMIVRHLLQTGTAVDEQNDEGSTALFIACEEGRPSLVQLLLTEHADPNIQNKKRRTALHCSVIKHQYKIAQSLLEARANVNIPDIEGNCALHHASLEHSEEMVKLLLQFDADPEFMNAQTATPLYLACKKQNFSIVRILLQHNANANVHFCDDDTPLHIAVLKDNPAMLKLLLEHGAKPNERGSEGRTPLHVAVLHHGSNDTMLHLLQCNRPSIVNLADNDGDTPLHYAAAKGNTEKVGILLMFGADRRCKNKIGVEPFEMALRADRFDVVRQFLEDGQDVSCNLRSGETLLYYCCRKGQTETVNLLLKKHADVDQLCSRGSALDAAVDNGSIDIVEQLIRHGASVTLKSRKHTSVLDRLYEQRHYYGRILQWTIKNAPDTEAPLKCSNDETLLLNACRDGAVDIVDWLLESNIDIGINIPNKLGRTPVYMLCKEKHQSLLSKLLRECKDVDVDAVDLEGKSPLHVACEHGDLFLINLLLHKSTKSLERKDKLERRPIHCVPRPEVISLLMRWKVDLGCEDYLGQTPLLLYCLQGKKDMVSAISAELCNDQMRASDRMDRNIVHLCVANQNYSILENVVQQARDLDFLIAKDINGQTGLHLAAEKDDLKSAKLLLEAGADPNVPDKCGLTPLLLSRSKVSDLLKHHGANIHHHSHQGCDYDTMCIWREQVVFNKTLVCFKDLVTRGEKCMEEIVNMPLIGLIESDSNQVEEFMAIKSMLRQFMNRLSEEVADIDPLMEFIIMPSGSMNEETKVGIPDEGDFVCLLPILSKKLQPPSRFIFDTTYVTLSAADDTDNEFDFKLLLDSNGKVLTQKLFHRFYQAVGLALARPGLWQDFPQLYRAMADDITGHHEKISNVTLFWHGKVYKWIEISVDVVPGIYWDGWRPAWCEDREVLETAKCAIVAKDIKHAPEEKRKNLFQLCFTECDAAMFSMMIPELKKGYMVAKLARQPHICNIMMGNNIMPLEPVSKYISSYMLKTATYHVFEDFKQNPRNFHFAGEMSETMAAVACARMIYSKLADALEQNFLEMFFVPAFDIFRNHFERRFDLEVAKSYCMQLMNLLSKNPEPYIRGIRYESNVDF